MLLINDSSHECLEEKKYKSIIKPATNWASHDAQLIAEGQSTQRKQVTFNVDEELGSEENQFMASLRPIKRRVEEYAISRWTLRMH